MADDQNQDQTAPAEEKVEEAAETATEAAAEATQAAQEVKEAVEEVKEVAQEIKEEVKIEEPKKESKKVSASLEKIIETIEKLSVLELAELVHALEEKFGVSAQAPVAVAAAGAAPAGSGEPVEEKTTFNVILSSSGANKIAAIKAVRELVPTLGLKEAKDLVEAAPKPVLESVNKTTAEEAKAKLTAAGATVELQ